MLKTRIFLLAMLLLTLFSSQALAYQYGYYSPGQYNAPPAYYNPYARAPYPYYPAYRYPAQPVYRQARMPEQAPAVPAVSFNTPAQDSSTDSTGLVEDRPKTVSSADERDNRSINKKQAFISTLLPYIENENRRLAALRDDVSEMFSRLERDGVVTTSEQEHIKKLAIKYRVKGSPLEDTSARVNLLRKIDIIPSSLALAQAANESAWGESRFAQEANNLFGIWTYDEAKGLKPVNREKGKSHLVRIFDDVGESVRYYMYTLNSHPAYKELREIRHQLRVSDRVIDGHELAAGLENYSAKGQSYIDLIQSLIRQNEWARLDTDKQRA